MTRILQCLVWITVMTASGRTQRGYPNRYLQNPHSIIFPDATHENYQHQNHRQTEQQPELNRRHRIQNKVSELRRTEAPFRIHLSKRGAIESELSSQVVFPGPSSKTKFEPEVSEQCRKLGYCESIPPNYPMDAVRRIVNQLGDDADDKFQMDVLDTDSVQIAQRYGSEGLTIRLCDSNLGVSTPYSLPDKEDVWWSVLQYPEGNKTQGFRTETCLNRDGSCSGLAFFERGYKGRCEQVYSFREVYTVENDIIKPKKRLLKIPSCCSCVAISLK